MSLQHDHGQFMHWKGIALYKNNSNNAPYQMYTVCGELCWAVLRFSSRMQKHMCAAISHSIRTSYGFLMCSIWMWMCGRAGICRNMCGRKQNSKRLKMFLDCGAYKCGEQSTGACSVPAGQHRCPASLPLLGGFSLSCLVTKLCSVKRRGEEGRCCGASSRVFCSRAEFRPQSLLVPDYSTFNERMLEPHENSLICSSLAQSCRLSATTQVVCVRKCVRNYFVTPHVQSTTSQSSRYMSVELKPVIGIGPGPNVLGLL